jgi:hypothetical protein
VKLGSLTWRQKMLEMPFGYKSFGVADAFAACGFFSRDKRIVALKSDPSVHL